jgi:hypothetical protein
MLVNYKPPLPVKNKDPNRPVTTVDKPKSDTISEMTGTTFLGAVNANTVLGNDSILHTHITCHNCQSKGHHSPNCPNSVSTTGIQHLQLNDTQHDTTKDTSSGFEYHFILYQKQDSYTSIPRTQVPNHSRYQPTAVHRFRHKSEMS